MVLLPVTVHYHSILRWLFAISISNLLKHGDGMKTHHSILSDEILCAYLTCRLFDIGASTSKIQKLLKAQTDEAF